MSLSVMCTHACDLDTVDAQNILGFIRDIGLYRLFQLNFYSSNIFYYLYSF